MVREDVVVVKTDGIFLSRFHLTFIYVLILWPIIFLICFVTQQEWFVGYQGYLTSFPSGGSGRANNSPNASFSNAVLSDEGRQNILWVSFLFALLKISTKVLLNDRTPKNSMCLYTSHYFYRSRCV
mgnify:CR=1 FL=1